MSNRIALQMDPTRIHGRHGVELGSVSLAVLAWHVTMRLRVDRVLAHAAADFRAASRIIVEQGAPRGLLAFRVVDTHVHAIVVCSRFEAGRFAGYSASALRQKLALPSPFEAARLTPIVELRHLYHAVPYVLRQAEHHGAAVDPTHDGSSLPDLFGLRCIDSGATGRLTRALPRLERRQLLPTLEPATTDNLSLTSAHLADAAAAALALPDLLGRDSARVAARRAAVHAAHATIRTDDVARALGMSARAVRRARAEPSEPELVRAIQLQAMLRAGLVTAPFRTIRSTSRLALIVDAK